ncbi:uncharacterized protein BDR25DRAFT_347876 [Lindgomyces ingoldianus]|uniref:Uncharacterized protein n=1 Tax=Lindgomyces ingoldianus TaxID=673940 RepID=A0ACB6RE55_9PLEO|nr:uncharacterized protein BDR25DRAFT_347876 [Lindgomyces ingoldianus]KAF2477524.1 hypothetical protein BDR25DRAFT_347876 [Lindgomyces ingoldianus]
MLLPPCRNSLNSRPHIGWHIKPIDNPYQLPQLASKHSQRLTLSIMYLPTLLSLLILSSLCLTQTTPINLTLIVTNFSAFMANPYIEGPQSNLSFHVLDPRPGFYAEADCIIPPTYFNLYAISALWDYCGERALDISYRFGEGYLTVRRGWRVDNVGKMPSEKGFWEEKGNSTYLTGSSTQNTYWSASGPDANETRLPDGELFTRKKEWLFPVTRLQTSTPP